MPREKKTRNCKTGIIRLIIFFTHKYHRKCCKGNTNFFFAYAYRFSKEGGKREGKRVFYHCLSKDVECVVERMSGGMIDIANGPGTSGTIIRHAAQ